MLIRGYQYSFNVFNDKNTGEKMKAKRIPYQVVKEDSDLELSDVEKDQPEKMVMKKERKMMQEYGRNS